MILPFMLYTLLVLWLGILLGVAWAVRKVDW